MKQTKDEQMDIGAELDLFLNQQPYETANKESLKAIKSGIGKIVKRHFKTKTHHTFVEVYAVEDILYALIGFRELGATRFSFISCQVGKRTQE